MLENLVISSPVDPLREKARVPTTAWAPGSETSSTGAQSGGEARRGLAWEVSSPAPTAPAAG